MAISVADNFSYKGAKPLDARIKYNSVADMKAVSESDLYDGCLAYVTATKKNYQYDSTNSVDPTTGKWRELQTGGGGGEGGHIIEDDGTEMTQRDTLDFVDFDLEDDDTNEKTVVQSHELTQEEFAEIFSSGLPGAITGFDLSNTSCESNIHSTDERVIGQWIDGKPLYQKTVDTGALPNNTTKSVATSIANINNVIDISGFAKSSNGTRCIPILYAMGGSSASVCLADVRDISSSGATIRLNASANLSDFTTSYVTIRYTKIADSAVSSGEKIVGQWIDGKPIFEKVIEFGALPNKTSKEVNHNISNLSKVIYMQGYCYNPTNGNFYPITLGQGGSTTPIGGVAVSCNSSTIKVTVYIDFSSYTESYITIRYTKS